MQPLLHISASEVHWNHKCPELKLQLYCDQRSVGQSPFGVGHPPGAHDQMLITVGHFRFSSYGAPSLTRERVCNLLVQLLLGTANAVTLRPKSRRTHDYTLLSRLRLGSLSVAS
jgi:hypothetical protein